MPPPYQALNTGLLLYIPYRFLEERVLAALRDQGSSITTSQARVFQRIGPDGSRQVDLAAATSLTKQSVGFLVDQLEAAGYVTRGPDPTDARARLVTITARGKELVAAGSRGRGCGGRRDRADPAAAPRPGTAGSADGRSRVTDGVGGTASGRRGRGG